MIAVANGTGQVDSANGTHAQKSFDLDAAARADPSGGNALVVKSALLRVKG